MIQIFYSEDLRERSSWCRDSRSDARLCSVTESHAIVTAGDEQHFTVD